jgi:hypothetical protein
MGWGKKTSGFAKPPISDMELKSKLKELEHLEKWAFRPRHGRFDFYKYLKRVYNLCDWTDPKASRRIQRQVAKLSNLKVRARTIPVRTVIDATSSSEDRDEKSEWAQALQYAIRRKVRGTAFKNFLERNGGPSGCAKKMAALRKKKLASKQSLGARTWGKKKSSSPTKGARQPFGCGS